MERVASRTDKSTLASLGSFTFPHLDLTLAVDFETKTIAGTATWTVVMSALTSELVLDTSAGLTVRKVTVCGVQVEHTMRAPHAAFGVACVIPVPEAVREVGRELSVALEYETGAESTALQWLPPEQTAGKQWPYMFSQCQAIHARALLPCPDAPTAKFTYKATVSVPEWATTLMSAVSLGTSGGDGAGAGGRRTFRFEQSVPIPSYLVAIAVGELHGIKVGPRSTVWAEPSVVEAAAWEFAEAEEYLVAGETVTGQPYVWGIYDILCMPPSFPYGGMENPCLTFATPTLLAGDRSLANVIAHEIAHSWTGNLVTNQTWEHFWLNEGWTRWLENRILVHCAGGGAEGEALYDFSMQESATHLADDVRKFGETNLLTALVPPLDGVDPDDAFGAVPYEKGLALLNLLTATVGGRPTFETFCKSYIGRFKMKTLTSADFRDFFLKWCEEKKIDASAIDWEAWFLTPGMPLVASTFPDTLGGGVTRVAEAWLEPGAEANDAFSAAEYQGWPSKLRVHFHEVLLARSLEAEVPPMSVAALAKMESLYGLSVVKNAEIRVRWQRLCIRHRAAFVVPQVLAFVQEVGRMKFVRPLYRDLFAWADHRQAAVDTFSAWRQNYHPIAAKMLAQDLQLN